MTPRLNLIVLRSDDMERLAAFYQTLGLKLTRHRHGKGPEHFGTESGDLIFEIYAKRNADDSTRNVRLGFVVDALDQTLESLKSVGATIVSEPKTSPWGRRCVIDDIEGHRIELVENPPPDGS